MGEGAVRNFHARPNWRIIIVMEGYVIVSMIDPRLSFGVADGNTFVVPPTRIAKAICVSGSAVIQIIEILSNPAIIPEPLVLSSLRSPISHRTTLLFQ